MTTLLQFIDILVGIIVVSWVLFAAFVVAAATYYGGKFKITINFFGFCVVIAYIIFRLTVEIPM